jgi:hypothetical protein
VDLVRQLETTIALSHNDRVSINIKSLVKELEGEDLGTVCEAIERGRRGEYGDVYRIDGITVMTWVTKRKRELAEEGLRTNQMGFM